MRENIFSEKIDPPSEESIRNALINSYGQLREIRDYLRENLGPTTEEWKYYGKKIGWTMKTLFKKRNLFFISICEGYFILVFVFGDRAVNMILDSEVSEELQNELENARKYAEGRGLQIRVQDDRYIDDIKLLIRYKLA